MKYLAVLGRQPEISLAELEALFSDVRQISNNLATFNLNTKIANINRLGGTLKLAIELGQKPLDFLSSLPDGKITLGISDYSAHASRKSATLEALKLKKILTRHGRSVRAVENHTAALSTATSLHNGLSGKNPRKVELIKVNKDWYRVTGVQDIDAYTQRDQKRPARDAKVGMLPPKLAQILINLCGPLPTGSRILDPFCGTGVVLQEALLMGYAAYGTDINERMVEYSRRNLEWLENTKIADAAWAGDGLGRDPAELAAAKPREDAAGRKSPAGPAQKQVFEVFQGDATSFQWPQPIDAVACEGYLGQPMSQTPTNLKLKEQKQICSQIILGFLKNLSGQIQPGTPVVIAAPAWLRPDGSYERLDIFDRSRSLSEEKRSFSSEATQNGQLFSQKKVDQINKLGYNVNNKSREGLIYCREGQIVARDILILRKK